MLVPANKSFFNDFMMSPFDAFCDVPSSNAKSMPGLMKTDVKETDDAFKLTIDLPGMKKENVTAELKNGYLEVSAHTHLESEDADAKSAYLRKERFDGTCSRSFYVGDDITQEDVKAKYDNGILSIAIPKKTRKQIEEKKTIAIEG